jgi:hypothetical protein
VEDMFERDFYVRLVNSEFAKELKTLELAVLNAKEPRTVRAVEAWVAANPLDSGTFGHYRPAQVSDASKDRFEAAFKHLNALLKRRH